MLRHRWVNENLSKKYKDDGGGVRAMLAEVGALATGFLVGFTSVFAVGWAITRFKRQGDC